MPKIEARRVAAFLRDPGAARLVLLYGDDPGLVRERSDALLKAVVGGDDPFRVAELARDQAQRGGALAGEAAALAMTGGRRFVRVRDATDALAPAAREVLAGRGEALVVLEAGELPRSSRLRALAEGPGEAVAVECWRERGEALTASIGEILREEGVKVEPSALDWLSERLGEDRRLMRRSLEKLALYVGPGGMVGEEDVLACLDEGISAEIGEALLNATAGDVPRTDALLDGAFSEGLNPVAAIRAALRHVQRLHLAALAVAAGQPPGTAMQALRPPVFFRDKPGFERALRIWRPPALAEMGAMLLRAEARVKSGGTGKPVPDRAVAREAVMALARRAAALARR
ncbi:DNA polymerase III subunit delta [Roseomonas gilardii]|uniref:DNA-directed DNA polymerase n=1 Tax=Roseomonas gilardii TaxID=257708 RepID=A0A1L7AJ74_9PROT|nr:DNA polymerase III subunit delta [Roseomonas gilardii]APT58802.1 DNA polymerase III subunit delta [Roseomonas gilardii]